MRACLVDPDGQPTQTPSTLAAASITAENGGTDWISVRGPITVSIMGTFSATATIQRRYTDGATPFTGARDVETWTAPVEDNYFEPSMGAEWRIFVKTGAFTSGQVDVEIRN